MEKVVMQFQRVKGPRAVLPDRLAVAAVLVAAGEISMNYPRDY